MKRFRGSAERAEVYGMRCAEATNASVDIGHEPPGARAIGLVFRAEGFSRQAVLGVHASDQNEKDQDDKKDADFDRAEPSPKAVEPLASGEIVAVARAHAIMDETRAKDFERIAIKPDRAARSLRSAGIRAISQRT